MCIRDRPYGISLLFHSYIRNASLPAILEGIVRLAIFLSYVALIAGMKDIRLSLIHI